MISNIIAKLVIFALKNKKITGESKTLIMNHLLSNINAIMIRNIISFDEKGNVKLGDRTLSREQSTSFREGCRTLMDNPSRKAIHDQICYEAIKLGVHNGLNSEMIQFSKAALWWGEQENALISSIVQE